MASAFRLWASRSPKAGALRPHPRGRKQEHPRLSGCAAALRTHRKRARLRRRCALANIVDFKPVSTSGLESSPVATALAGLRANEARYFKNKYDHVFTVEPANKAKKGIDWGE